MKKRLLENSKAVYYALGILLLIVAVFLISYLKNNVQFEKTFDKCIINHELDDNDAAQAKFNSLNDINNYCKELVSEAIKEGRDPETACTMPRVAFGEGPYVDKKLCEPRYKNTGGVCKTKEFIAENLAKQLGYDNAAEICGGLTKAECISRQIKTDRMDILSSAKESACQYNEDIIKEVNKILNKRVNPSRPAN